MLVGYLKDKKNHLEIIIYLFIITSLSILISACDETSKSPSLDTLPGTMVGEKVGAMQRQLLRTLSDGSFEVQDYYFNFPYTSPFLIKNKKDLTKGLAFDDRLGSYYNLIDSLDGPLTLYWIWHFQENNGPKILDAYYKHGKREGVWKGFYKAGTQAFEENYQNNKLNGVQKRWYKSGKPRSEYTYNQGLLEGQSHSWYEKGSPLVELTFHQGLREGIYRYWYPDGQLWIEGQFKNDKKQGQWIYWNPEGKKQKVIQYQQGKIISKEELIPAFKKVTLEGKTYCGSFQDHIVNMEFKYLISASYFEGKIMADAGCNDQVNTFVIHYLWPSFEPARPSDPVAPYERKIEIMTMGNVDGKSSARSVAFFYDLLKLYTSEQARQDNTKFRDPETGLWRLDAKYKTPNPARVYWSYDKSGQVNRRIICNQIQALEDIICRLTFHLPDYKADIELNFPDSLLPQWKALEVRARQFIYQQTRN